MTHILNTGGNNSTSFDVTELVPGNVRAVGSTSAELHDQAKSFDNLVTDVVGSTRDLQWTGAAANAFATHRSEAIGVADRWLDSVHTVVEALTDHHTVLAHAQHRAAEVFELRQQAQRDTDELAHWDADDDAHNASNYTTLRAQLQAGISANRQRAQELLDEVRRQLAEAGTDTARTIRQAQHNLHAAVLPQSSTASSSTALANAQPGSATIVRAPHDGIHDTLWAIAQRELGDGNRWREIYELNAGHLVGTGPHAVLTNPNDIQPGWILRLPPTHLQPTTVAPPTHHPPTAAPPTPSPSPGPAVAPGGPPLSGASPLPGPAPAPPPGPSISSHSHIPAAPPAASTPVLHASGGRPADFGDGLIIAGGVGAALVAAGALTLSRRARRGGGQRPVVTDPTIGPPAVDENNRELDALGFTDQAASIPSQQPCDVPLGHRDGRTMLIDTAAALGLGLTGAGAPAATRALLLSQLATHPQAVAVITAAVRHRLLDGSSPNAVPSNASTNPIDGTDGIGNQRVRITASLQDALANVEAELVTRTRTLEETAGHATPPPLLLIVAAPDDPARLEAIADCGAGLGISVVVVGVWRPSITCQISADGRIARVIGQSLPNWAGTLVGLHSFSASAQDTVDLLKVLGPSTRSPTSAPATEPSAGQIEARRAASVQRVLNPTPRQAGTSSRSRIISRLAPPLVDGDQDENRYSEALRAPEPHKQDQSAVGTVRRPRPFELTVLGQVQLQRTLGGSDPLDLGAGLTPKQREIVICLAVHRDGVRTAALNDAIWPDASPTRPFNTLHSTLSQLRRTLRSAINDNSMALVVYRNGRYALDPEMVDVDLWHLTDALHIARTAIDQQRVGALHDAINRYPADLAEDYTGEWLEQPRDMLRRDVIDALAALIRAIRQHKPEQALALLERARRLDPHNEAIYRDIMRIQSRLGHFDAINRTMTLLRTALADIDTRPTSDTETLAVHLQHSPRSISSAPERRTA